MRGARIFNSGSGSLQDYSHRIPRIPPPPQVPYVSPRTLADVNAGMDGYIAKPVNAAELLAAIEGVMASCNSSTPAR